MAARRVRVCVQYIRPAPCPFWPPSPPTWIPAVAGIYMFSLDYLFLFQTCRVAMLFRGLGRFLPCLSPSFSFFRLFHPPSHILFTEPFFSLHDSFFFHSFCFHLFFSYPVCVLDWIGLPEGTSERRKNGGKRLCGCLQVFFFCTIRIPSMMECNRLL